MNNDTCLSYLDTNLYIEYNLHQRHPIWSILTMLLQRKIDIDDHNTVSYSSQSLFPTDQGYSQIKREFFSIV